MTDAAAPPRSDPERGLSRRETNDSLRLSTWEAVWATVWMVLTTGAFQTGFALHLGATPFWMGLLAGLPAAVGLVQIPAALLIERRSERKRFVAFFAIFGRLCWLPILLLPFVCPAPARAPVLLILITVSAALLNMTAPAWTSWMSDMVPAESRGRYFGRRNMLAGLVAMLVPLPAGWLLDRVKDTQPDLGFAILFGVACIAGIACCILILRQPEPPFRPTPRGNPLRSLAEPLADTNFRHFLTFAALLVVGQGIAGPFFVTWQIDPHALAIPYLPAQVLGAVASGAGLATTQLWGYLADKYGPRPVLTLAIFAVATSPLLWQFTAPGHYVANVALLVVMNVISGAGWAAVGLTQFNLLIQLAPAERRSTYTAVFSSVTGVLGGLAPVVGGALMTALASVSWQIGPVHINNFKLLFLLAVAIRYLCPILLARVDDGHGESARELFGRLTQRHSFDSLRKVRQLTQPTDQEARQQAVEALGGMRAALAVEELAAAMDDVSVSVRESAARSLGEVGDPRAVPALAAKLFDPAAGIGELAADALGRIGDRSATPALCEAVRGQDASVRIAAIRALATLRDPDGAPVLLEALDAAHETRAEAACAAFMALGANLPPEAAEAALPRLLALLAPTSGRGVRLAAARTLEALADAPLAGVFKPLAHRLDAETDPAVIARLATAVSRFGAGRAEALEPLLKALDRTDGRGLAYQQSLAALADWAIAPGALYPLLSVRPLERDEAVGRLLTESGKRAGALAEYAALHDRFSQGDYAEILATVAERTQHPVAQALAQRDSPTAEEALLALVLLDQSSSL